MAEADDLRAGLFQSEVEANALRVVHERAVPSVFITVIAHQNRQVAARRQNPFELIDQSRVSPQEFWKGWRDAQVAEIVGVFLLAPIRRMDPDEIEFSEILVRRWNARVPAVANVKADVLDPEFLADIATRAGTGHWVEHPLRLEIQQQVLDQFAGAVARITAVPIRTRPRLVV